MRSRLVVAAAALVTVLTAMALVGALTRLWWVSAAAGWLLGCAAFTVAVETLRRTRMQAAAFADVRARLQLMEQRHSELDPLVARLAAGNRMLQAQYTARLERMGEAEHAGPERR